MIIIIVCLWHNIPSEYICLSVSVCLSLLLSLSLSLSIYLSLTHTLTLPSSLILSLSHTQTVPFCLFLLSSVVASFPLSVLLYIYFSFDGLGRVSCHKIIILTPPNLRQDRKHNVQSCLWPYLKPGETPKLRNCVYHYQIVYLPLMGIMYELETF